MITVEQAREFKAAIFQSRATNPFEQKQYELASSIEPLHTALAASRENEVRAAILAKAERGFELRGEGAANPFAGASAVFAQARERSRSLEEKIANAEADIAALRFADAFVRYCDVQTQIAGQNTAADALNERLAALDPVLKREQRNAQLFESRFQGPDQRAQTSTSIADEMQGEDEERRQILAEMENLSRRSQTLSSQRASIEHQFPGVKVLAAKRAVTGAPTAARG